MMISSRLALPAGDHRLSESPEVELSGLFYGEVEHRFSSHDLILVMYLALGRLSYLWRVLSEGRLSRPLRNQTRRENEKREGEERGKERGNIICLIATMCSWKSLTCAYNALMLES